jgi:cytochrome c oxidase cbb3-type subunit 2
MVDGRDIEARMRVLRLLGDPYSDADLLNASDVVKGKSELDALVAYLQGLGTSPVQEQKPAPDATAASMGGAR